MDIINLINTENDLAKKQEYILKAIEEYAKILKDIDIRDYLLIDSKPKISKEVVVEAFYNTGTLYKTIAEINNTNNIAELNKNILLRNGTTTNTEKIEGIFRKAISYFLNVLRIKFEDANATLQIISIYTQLCFINQNDKQKCLSNLQEGLLYSPTDLTRYWL